MEPKLEYKIRLAPLALSSYRLFQQGITIDNQNAKTNTLRKYELFNPSDPDSIAYYKDFFVSEFSFNSIFNQPNPPNNSNTTTAPINPPIRKQLLLTRALLPTKLSLKSSKPYPLRAF